MTRNPDAERSEDGEPESGSGTDGPAVGPERPVESGDSGEAAESVASGAEGQPASEGPEAEPGDGGRATPSGDGAPASERKPVGREPVLPADEEAAWAAIVAGYGREPDAEDAAAPDGSGSRPATGPEGAGSVRPAGGDGDTPVRSFTVYSAGTGPRDYVPDDGEDGEDEGHFVPPEPPPLPEADPTTKFAWLAALGGPLLLFFCMLTGTTMTWWLYTLGIGGFLGGFATLVTRMRDDSEEDGDDPGRGAVV